MTIATYQGFKAFVMKQCPTRDIDHTGGWRRCAVGNYYAEEKIQSFYEDEDHSFSNLFGLWDIEEFAYPADEAGEVGNMLNKKGCDTYGELQEFMAGYTL